MRHRCFTWLGVVTPVLVVSLMVPVAGQAPKAGAFAKTPWGDPDLQGTWSNATITPLERPQSLSGKETLTPADVAALEARAAESRQDRPPRAGDPGTYNQFWFDRGTKVVSTHQSSLIVDPPDGKIPWTDEWVQKGAELEKQRQALLDSRAFHQSWTDLDTGERCITDGIPWVPYAYNNNYQITQAPGYIAILHEMFREMRIIPIGNRPHGAIPQWFGDSRAHWEGDTLVIDTVNFADRSSEWWSDNWRPARPTLHLTERLKRTAPDTVMYEFTMEDPTRFQRPWTARVPMTKTNEPVFEYACHEGNIAIVGVLAGARVKEKAAADAAAAARR